MTQRDPIPMELWSKDHWSTFAYIETRVVDHNGVPNRDHLRCNPKIHPGLGNGSNQIDRKPRPTMLKDGTQIHPHDDWSCIDDMVSAGYIEWNGTGMNPVFALTEKGWWCASALRQHMADGGQCAEFELPVRAA